MRPILRIMSCSIAVSLLFHRAAGAYENPAFTINISTPRAVVKTGEPVVVHVSLKSISKEPFKVAEVVNSGQAELNYNVEVRSADGRLAPYTKYGREVIDNKIIAVSRRLDTLREGEQVEEEMFLDKFVNLTKLGAYTIWLGRKDPLNHGLLIKSNSLVIHVTR